MRALYRFVELDGNFIDTAWVYDRADEPGEEEGEHCSEELIGKFIKESRNREKVIIASKIPPKNRKWPAWKGIPISEVSPKGYVEEYVDSSLTSLGINTIDLMQFHVWQDEFAKDDDWKSEIDKITKKGKVKHLGISINDYQPSNCLKTLDTGLIGSIQLIFNIYHQLPIKRLFPYAKANNIGLIARVPLDEGGLTGKLTRDTMFDDEMRSVFFRKDRLGKFVESNKRLKELMKKEASSLPELALRYILGFDEISTTIPGTRKIRHAELNAAVSDGRKLTEGLMKTLEDEVWERNFFPDHEPFLKDNGYVEK